MFDGGSGGVTVGDPGGVEDAETLFGRMTRAADSAERQYWRDRVIAACLPIAEHIAYRFIGRGESFDDLVQVARLGLVKAVDRYDPGRGPFLSFAIPTVMGEVRRHFRDNTWGMRVSRHVQDSQPRLRRAIDTLSQRLGRAPSASELGAELGLSREDVVASLQATYAYRPASLDAVMPHGSGEYTGWSRQGAEDPRYGVVEDALTVSALVRELPERDRMIVQMRFCECLSQSQIAQRLGISQVHVSRLLSATLERLRMRLEAQEPGVMAG